MTSEVLQGPREERHRQLGASFAEFGGWLMPVSYAGTVAEQLPSRLYRVRLEGGGSVTAHVADRIDRNFVRLIVGDRVVRAIKDRDLYIFTHMQTKAWLLARHKRIIDAFDACEAWIAEDPKERAANPIG